MIYEATNVLCFYFAVCFSLCMLCVLVLLFTFVFAPSTALNAFCWNLGLLCASVWSTIVTIGSFLSLLFLIIGYAILSNSPLSQLASLLSTEHIFTTRADALNVCAPPHSVFRHCSKNEQDQRMKEMYDILFMFETRKKETLVPVHNDRKLLFCSLFSLALWRHFQTPPFCALTFRKGFNSCFVVDENSLHDEFVGIMLFNN